MRFPLPFTPGALLVSLLVLIHLGDSVSAAPLRFQPPGPCVPLPPIMPRDLPPGKAAYQPGSSAAAADAFAGDLDGDGIPDRVVAASVKTQGEDDPEYFHIFVMRGTCGHWLGGARMAEQISLSSESYHGLRVIVTDEHVSGGAQQTQYRFNGQLYQAFRYRVWGRNDSGGWLVPDPEPPPPRPVIDPTPQRPLPIQDEGRVRGALLERGFQPGADGTLRRGPLRVSLSRGFRESGVLTLADGRAAPCAAAAPERWKRLDCGLRAYLAEAAGSFGGCGPFHEAGVVWVYCQGGLRLTAHAHERREIQILYEGTDDNTKPGAQTCDAYPHTPSTLVTPDKTYCLGNERYTSRSTLPQPAHLGCDFTYRDAETLVLVRCATTHFQYGGTGRLLQRIDIFPPVAKTSVGK